MQPEFDVIVVGAGPAGSAAALTLARRGFDVLMLEKGKIPGERNTSGGILYGDFGKDYGLINLVPDFESRAPLERRITSHEVLMLGKPDWAKGKASYYRLSKASFLAKAGFVTMDFETGHDYSVLRRPFDRWFANLAVEEGAMLSTETTAVDLLMDSGSVVGVRTTKEDLHSKLVIDCSGVTSGLVEKAGLRERLVPRQLYQGTKRVYRLDPGTMEKRFRLKPGEGRAFVFLGSFMLGVQGGSFIYTNGDTLSVGIVASMDSLIRETTERFDRVGKLIDVQDEFERQPMVAELLEGAELVEYSAHNIPKGYKCLLKKPYADGYMAAGDALGAFVKVGPMIDGMRRGIASGMMAAEAFAEASRSGSFRSRNISRYRDLLTPIYEDVNRSGRDSFFAESRFTYQRLPGLLFAFGLGQTHRFDAKATARRPTDALQRVQAGTSLLVYDEDEAYSHIKVEEDVASMSITKPWIPACPVNCYTLVSPRGVFASFHDLYEQDVASLVAAGEEQKDAARKAFKQAQSEISSGRLKFDHVACVACGTCGAIGPEQTVAFGDEREGHGVRYKYG